MTQTCPLPFDYSKYYLEKNYLEKMKSLNDITLFSKIVDFQPVQKPEYVSYGEYWRNVRIRDAIFSLEVNDES